jgi:hypothetical protein
MRIRIPRHSPRFRTFSTSDSGKISWEWMKENTPALAVIGTAAAAIASLASYGQRVKSDLIREKEILTEKLSKEKEIRKRLESEFSTKLSKETELRKRLETEFSEKIKYERELMESKLHVELSKEAELRKRTEAEFSERLKSEKELRAQEVALVKEAAKSEMLEHLFKNNLHNGVNGNRKKNHDIEDEDEW